ncbi:hypothetical protein [Thiosocius teredinicola]|uniref:hypothetical protein n=1 Tax=Thiosocius teredinicola TaxID=1973002 RepID=UPI000F78E1AC
MGMFKRSSPHSPQARLMAELPANRYSIAGANGRAPIVGDILELDQGFTSEDGLTMVLAYCRGRNESFIYSAEVYESELGPPIES